MHYQIYYLLFKYKYLETFICVNSLGPSLAKPKSPILGSPHVSNKILPDFISPWINGVCDTVCKYWRPLK